MPKNKGFSFGIKIFKDNLNERGSTGVHFSDKAFSTCRKYQNDKSIKKTKNNKPLTKKTRAYYGSIADGLLYAYNLWQNNKL